MSTHQAPELAPELRERFPDLSPTRGVPSVVNLHGIGLMLYGHRDHDPQTASHVTTRCITLIYVPILTIDAWRISPTHGGFYILGRTPLSSLAKAWNLLMAAGLCAAIAVPSYQGWYNAPEQVAARSMVAARSEDAAGHVALAAERWVVLTRGRTAQQAAAQAAMEGLLPRLPALPPSEAAPVLKILVRWGPKSQPVQAAARSLIAARIEAASEDSLDLIEAAAPVLGPDAVTLRRQGLERLVARLPTEPRWAIELARACEDSPDAGRCEALLAPHQAQLGDGEGARILGRIRAAQERHAEAYALLEPYCRTRLQQLHAAEKHLGVVEDAAWKRAIEDLKHDRAEPTWYKSYESAKEADRERMVQEWASERMRADGTYKAAIDDLRRKAAIVPVAIDLGIATLHRARAQTDPKAQRSGLEEAERVFLSVRGIAGESDTYQLMFGEVCWWLGKSSEARTAFNAYVGKERPSRKLTNLAGIMRSVGGIEECRTLAEEAWKAATTDADKHDSANLRAATARDRDDMAVWLERCADGPWKWASLAMYRGNKAEESGNDAEAVTAYRDSLRQWQEMRNLHNAGIVADSIYRLSGEQGDLEAACRFTEDALARDPRNTVTMSCAITHDQQLMELAVLGARLPGRFLVVAGSEAVRSAVITDAAGWRAIEAALAAAPQAQQARSRLAQRQILAPRDPGSWSEFMELPGIRRDAEALTALQRAVQSVDIDHGGQEERRAAWISGSLDDRFRRTACAAATRIAALPRSEGPGRGAILSATIQNQVSRRQVGDAVDLAALETMAAEIHAAQPSMATRGALLALAYERALDHLIAGNPAAGKALAAARRRLGTGPLLDLAADGPQRAALAADLAQAAVWQAELTAIAGAVDATVVHLHTALGHPQAQAMAAIWKADPTAAAKLAIARAIDPGDHATRIDALRASGAAVDADALAGSDVAIAAWIAALH